MADAAARGGPRAAAQNLPPSLLPRRIAAVILALLLWTTASPFTPISWLIQSDWTTALDGPSIIDRVLGPVVLLGAAALHWYIAGAVQPLPLTITVPDLRALDAAQLNQQAGQNIPTSTLVLGLWLPGYFWAAAAAEGALLWTLRFADFAVGEAVRRSALVAVIASVWVLGWNALPWYRKQQAWALMKDYVIRLVIMEMVEMAFGGGRQRRRRRRM
ncbi:unnamed protein product [Discula destructiva]